MSILTRSLLTAASLLIAASTTPAQDWPAQIPDDVGERQTTDSGLQYSVICAGSGDSRPSIGDKVTVRYSGWLQDGGKLFDSSEKQGKGATSTFELGRVVQGWNEGLQLMSPGARFKLIIPAALGYGDRGSPPRIPGGATLVFLVELVAFSSPPKFVALGEEGLEKLELGNPYRVLAAGTGENPTAEQIVDLRYSLWDRNGRLYDTSHGKPTGILSACKSLPLEFLQVIAQKMRLGCRVVLETSLEETFPNGVPPQLSSVPGGKLVWQLEVAEIREPLPVPEFRMPADDELTATESGLRYVIVDEGAGDAPTRGAQVKMHYAGWLTDGTLFDSSFSRAEPFPVPVGMGRVIRGWDEALLMMKPGAKWIVVIPADLGYGDRGSPPTIPGGATLVFYMEMLKDS